MKEETPPGQVELARQLYDAGDYTAAAEEFLKLAQNTQVLLEDDTPSLLKQGLSNFCSRSVHKSE